MEYKWKLKNTEFTKDKGKVFSCFSCGGGSTMGYKLAGFDVIGCNEIDKKMMDVYKINHNPKYSYLEGIQTFKDKKELPKELYDLDILDGSPPCSSFSMSGNRGKDWGKEKKFKEGQSSQVLDTLFFDFIDLSKRLQPKFVIAENVKGILMGDAKKYCSEIYNSFDKAGYYLDKWLLDSSIMGVPQKRERVFFIAIRKDLSNKLERGMDLFNNMPKLNLIFNKKEILFNEVQETTNKRKKLLNSYLKHWENTDKNGRSKETKNKKTFGFFYKAMKNKVLKTIIAGGAYAIEENPLLLTKKELCLCGSFPLDYNFNGVDPQYLIGMSVPPLMIKNIAIEISNQWLSKL